MSGEILHFTFSPVQSFVSQTRRTRDLWAGSYLLSYLAGRAMFRIEQIKGSIIFPDIKEDPLMNAIRGKPREGESHLVGSLPNRFSARGEDAARLGLEAEEALRRAWQHIAEAVWQKLSVTVGSHLMGPLQKEIWDRQCRNLWEILWVVGEDGSYMERRKQWRNFKPEPEPGEKCTLCGERQALAGDPEASRAAAREYWREFSARLAAWRQFELEEDGSERLCAICLIKRFYPLTDAMEWPVPTSYESTMHLAAKDWLAMMEEKKDLPEIAGALGAFVQVVDGVGIPKEGEEPGAAPAASPWDAFLGLHRGVCFQSDLMDLLRDKPPEIRREVIEARKELARSLKKYGLPGEPDPYYGLLLMDGDNMGVLLSEYKENQQEISAALTEFSRRVPEIVRKHKGQTIYAGGDDVLALLPMDAALKCASELRREYLACFKKHHFSDPRFSISAAIVYAHKTTPLRQIIADAHHVLDAIAKERNGRDSFVLRIWKRNSPGYHIARPWAEEKNGRDHVAELLTLVAGIKQGRCSSQVLYALGDLFHVIEPENEKAILDDDQALKLITAELLATRETGKKEKDQRLAEAQDFARQLLGFVRATKWQKEKDGRRLEVGRIEPAALRVLRFLANQEV